ncbi:MAG: radical SAM protein, partial [Myxococcales bacterium]|nr:radical SAM protein [Myxococcales bacterium]
FVVRGEGEHTFVDLLAGLRDGRSEWTGCQGLSWRAADGTPVHEPDRPPPNDLDAMPFPAWDLVDLAKYHTVPRGGVIYAHKEFATMFSSRACPWRCTYCHNSYGKAFRARSAEHVLAEIDLLVRDHGVKELVFMDDIFNFRPDRAKAIAQGLIDRDYGLKLTFPNGFRGDILDEELVLLLKRAGMYRCMVAVESAVPRIQKVMKKNLKIDKVQRIVDFIADQGVMVHGAFMLGFPTESVEELNATVEFALKSKCLIASFFTVVPFPGSDLWDMAIREFPDWERMAVDSHYYEEEPYYTQAHGVSLRKIQRAALLKFYLNPWRMVTTFRRIPYKRDLLRNLYPLAQITFGWFMRGKDAKLDKSLAMGHAIEAMNTV